MLCFDFGEGRREQKYGYRMSATFGNLEGELIYHHKITCICWMHRSFNSWIFVKCSTFIF